MAQFSVEIRHPVGSVLAEKQQVSIRQVSKDTSISRSTIRKILDNEVPVPYKSRRTYHRKLNPHLSKLTELTEQNNSLPPYARLSVRNIFDIIKSDNQYEGSYGAVKDYVRSLKNKETSIWEHIYEIVKNWSREDAIKFLYLLSRADPPILSKRKAKKYLEEAALLLKNATKSDKREHKERAEYEWMRALLQKDLRASDVDLGVLGIPEVPQLLQKLYRGRLIDRNRSMVILANHKRITARTVCKFLGIDRATRKTYIDTYEAGGASRLFQRQPKANRKSEDTILKESVFSLLHEPPCNYGINRTTWIMRDLCGVLTRIMHSGQAGVA